MLDMTFSTLNDLNRIREISEPKMSGGRGLEDGLDPHFLDVAEIIGDIWETLKVETMA